MAVCAYAKNIIIAVKISMGKKQEAEAGGARRPRRRWLWRLGVVTTGVAGTALFLLRGCWHRKMSWPIRVEGYSYQVCLGCGVKRLFDEGTFQGYGKYCYDLHELITRERAARLEAYREAEARTKAVSAS